MNEVDALPSTPLTVSEINKTIDLACTATSTSLSSFKSINDSSSSFKLQWQRLTSQASRSPLLYGIVGEIEDVDVENNDPALKLSVQATFYFAYSTWDGRILHVDQIHVMNGGSFNIANNAETKQVICTTIYRTLASIAITLHCRRLTWQQIKDYTVKFPNGLVQPQTLHGWLTLHWGKASIEAFLRERGTGSHSSKVESSKKTATTMCHTSSSFRDTIEATIQEFNLRTTQQQWRLRLAKYHDTATIGRLVQGLAIYEKEPDAVHVTHDHYDLDGFQSNPPLFYCILLEVVQGIADATNETSVDPNDATTVQRWYACGMAFCWIGCRQEQPIAQDSPMQQKEETHFFYLEDLFIEAPYRGNGSGTNIMAALGEIALSLDCKKMVWQALDWNTPALTFYQNKIGAHIVDGLQTTRFAGSTLIAFHNG